MAEGRVVFETPLGPCALRWRDGFLVGLALCIDEAAARVWVPAFAESAVDALQRYLGGEPVALDGWSLDLGGTGAFRRRVWEALRHVPRGTTVTYGDLAVLAGAPGAARAVGTAMACNPLPLFIPCHRVVPASGGLGAFSGGRGPQTKACLLALERAG
jgi:methylated-DNA-[protein]-cysteine S-methyltransferase